jgi:hypothetical protein
MQSIWSESWKSSEFTTTKIVFTSRSVAALQENDLANRYPPVPSLTTTLGGTIAAVCFRCQSQRNYEFAMDSLAGTMVRVLSLGEGRLACRPRVGKLLSRSLVDTPLRR